MELQSILTLTYPERIEWDGKKVKKSLNSFLAWLRTRGHVEYIWFLEFQKRGAPHFHLILSLEYSDALHERVARAWARTLSRDCKLTMFTTRQVLRQHRRKGVFEKIRSEDGCTKYITKYSLKTKQKIVPKEYENVGRFWGTSRGVKNSIIEGKEIQMTEHGLRTMLEVYEEPVKDWAVLPKYIFVRNGNLTKSE